MPSFLFNNLYFKIEICCLLLGLAIPNYAQKVNVSGKVFDAQSGEFLISAHVHDTISFKGCISNEYGYYSMILLKGDTAVINCSYIGYQRSTIRFILNSDTVVNFYLPNNRQLKEVRIVGNLMDSNNKSSNMSSIKIQARDIQLMPNIFGEPNLMKSIQMLPGVQSGNDGDSQFYVRGGSPDQNLILLDEVPLYYVSHYGGVFSIFNADAINDVELIKGGFPAKYGGRLSSVLNVYMREGNKKKFQAKGNIGLLSSGGIIEGPIRIDTSSYLISFRRSMLDIYTTILGSLSNGIKNGFGFYDINTKLNYKLGNHDHFYFSFYNGNDRIFSMVKESDNIPYNAESNVKWGNTAVAGRWNHIFSPKIFSNTTLIYSKYGLIGSNRVQYPGIFENLSTYQSYIQDISAKSVFELRVSNINHVSFGISATKHNFNPGKFSYTSFDNNVIQADTSLGSKFLSTYEINGYVSDQFKYNRLEGNIGVHLSKYILAGKSFSSIEPRVSMKYTLYSAGFLKASYAKMKQYLHLLSSSGVGLPTDLWVPATDKVPPQHCDQWAFGWSHYLRKYNVELSLEGYYKIMKGLIEYQEGVPMFSGRDWQEMIEIDGTGKAYGLEFFARKQTGKITGWLAYTWSKNLREFSNINNGQSFYYRYDRPHEINLFFNQEIRKGINFSASWVFKKGNPITLPSGKYQLSHLKPGFETDERVTVIHIYPGKNQFRMRDYHRLDLSLSFESTQKNHNQTWSVGVINLYNRMNPSYYKINAKKNGSLYLVQVTEFPFLPYVSYSVNF